MLSSLCQSCSCGEGFVDCADIDGDALALVGLFLAYDVGFGLVPDLIGLAGNGSNHS